jgi:carbonic anhydrase/acetyltransferase-like protein (isoleucine patch superfamily)
MLIYEVNGKRPQFGQNRFIAGNAALAGDVVLGDECSAGFGTVARDKVLI